MLRECVKQYIQEMRQEFEAVSDNIWGYAEPAFKEFKSSECQRKLMEKLGFRITEKSGGLETAFMAEAGQGKPVIAFLGEVDALPELSQVAGLCEPKPLEEGAPGHGCGHNLLGVGSMEAAYAVKRYLEDNHKAGTVRYYCCPAEESGAGKAYMVTAGAFDGVDCAYSWHPSTTNAIVCQTMAVVMVDVKFTGLAAHAARAWEGRSALDALEMMNVGVQFLREHVTPETRIQYAITNTGGKAANVVQQVAEASYIIRCTDSEYLKNVYERLLKIAEGAALMADVKLEEAKLVSAYADLLSNRVMEEVIRKNFHEMLPIEYSEEEISCAETFKQCGQLKNADFPIDRNFIDGPGQAGCTDVADVSWVTPLAYIRSACHAIGSIPHSWSTTTQGKSALAHKGMHVAAELMADSGIDLLENPELVEQAKEQLKKDLNGRTYQTLIPESKLANPGIYGE